MSEHIETITSVERERAMLEHIGALLHWDRATEIPEKAVGERARVMSYVDSKAHALATDKKLARALRALKKETLPKKQARIVERYDRLVERQSKLPEEFVREYSELVGESEHAWERAKEQDDWNAFKPYLAKIIEMKKRYARYIDPKAKPYDVLIDDFEEGMTSERIGVTFAAVRDGLRNLLERIEKSDRFREPWAFRKITFGDGQRPASEELSRLILADPEAFVLKESAHPFTTVLSPHDVRITTHYRNDNLSSLSATIHEAGHALYEMGLKRAFPGSILGEAPSFGIHESQSRFWENHVGESYPFWKFYLKRIRKHMPEFSGIKLQEFYRAINRVKPSFIRIYADEVTYPFHIIIRFECERALFEGDISVDELPEFWNRKYEEYLGITPKTYREGVLQDVHWSMGAFGYFPSYLIGTIYASQIAARMHADIPTLREDITAGDFSGIREWLDRKIHRKGQMDTADAIIKRATGSGLDPGAFLSYLESKFLAIYK